MFLVLLVDSTIPKLLVQDTCPHFCWLLPHILQWLTCAWKWLTRGWYGLLLRGVASLMWLARAWNELYTVH